MDKDIENIIDLLDRLNIPKKTQAGAILSLYGRVTLLASRADRADSSSYPCLCWRHDANRGKQHELFCPAYYTE